MEYTYQIPVYGRIWGLHVILDCLLFDKIRYCMNGRSQANYAGQGVF